MADFTSSKARMTGIKETVTRSINSLKKLSEELENLIARKELKDIPERTVKRLAQNILKGRTTVEANLDSMDTIGAKLIEVITTLEPSEASEDPDAMIIKVNEDMESYHNKYTELTSKHAENLEQADGLLTPAKPAAAVTQSREPGNQTEYARYNVVSDLKPTFLDKETTMIEINHWCNQLENYINMGYRNNPPETGVAMHLGPLIHTS